jgi:hypothetical protein
MTGVPRWEFVEVQVVEVQLSDSDSSTGNKSDKCPPHEQRSTQKEVIWSDDWKMQQRAEFASLISLQTRKLINVLC